MTFTIEEINDAWIEWNKPIFLVNKKPAKEVKKGLIEYEQGQTIERKRPSMDFISWLIQWKTKKK